MLSSLDNESRSIDVPMAWQEKAGPTTASYLTHLAAWSTSIITEVMKMADGKTLRHLLPEPLDYFQHVGNSCTSMVLGAVTSGFTRTIANRSGGFTHERSQRIGLTIGMFAVVLANALVETKLGGGHYGTEDPIDFAYGIVGGVLGVSCENTFSNQLEAERSRQPSDSP